METIENIQKELKTILSEKRYLHSVGTMKMAQILAKKYGVDEQKAALAGLVHDIGKEMSQEESLNYIQKNNIELDEIEEKNPSLLHAKIGADLAKKKYGFDQNMQDAIKYHTTGHPHMDTLAKIIYVADKAEENRKYDDIEQVRTLMLQDLDEAVLYILNFNIQKGVLKNKLIHPNSFNARNVLLNYNKR